MTVKWYASSVIEAVEAATDLKRAALWVEGQTKANISDNGQVDTGFMRASVYSVYSSGSTYAEAASTAFGHADKKRKGAQKMAPIANQKVNKNCAVVAVGANYSIWQERKSSFLLKALTQLRLPDVIGRI